MGIVGTPEVIHRGTAAYVNKAYLVAADDESEAEDKVYEAVMDEPHDILAVEAEGDGFWRVTVRIFEVTDGDPS